MIGLTLDEQTQLHAAALTWRGTPFHPSQCLKGVGVDCIRLIVAIYREAGLLLDLTLSYPWGYWQHSGDTQFMTDLMRRFQVVTPPWEIGDGLTFRKRPWPGTGHTALYIGEGQVIHAIEGRRVDVWPLSNTILQHTLHEGWRLSRG
jgi:cell wall-associated NlpC family hydrolase